MLWVGMIICRFANIHQTPAVHVLAAVELRMWVLLHEMANLHMDEAPSKHKSIDTEDHAHNWYAAIRNFRQGVTRIVEEGVWGIIHQEDYKARLARSSAQILPVFPGIFHQ
ncbi:hypothetical protein PENPOL_c001G07937 [Penicillium polonicum]|uniref:Uncharacterized protein n=1 Tax=Penicillium polonicum TaxID=60169 RepID=A0A1V6P4A0_PENPO|nr:hypothetical protein PENPOL_c001G07937 [Penicillium polonicum]